jgi:threonine/homoserine/homoserine lactone efflux protein
MPSLSTYAVFLVTAIVLLLVPGPAVLYVVTRSIEMGRSGGLASVVGITTGTVAYVALASVGLSSLILASTVAFDVAKYVGAAYLFLLGVRRLFGRGLEEPGEEAMPRTRRPDSCRSPARLEWNRARAALGGRWRSRRPRGPRRVVDARPGTMSFRDLSCTAAPARPASTSQPVRAGLS